jgi:indolepyruvate ferredoxin oxidoreductase
VSDEPGQVPGGYFAPEIEIFDRTKLDDVQKSLREVDGTTVLLYDQTCAAEKRRRRKRGTFPDPQKRVFINELSARAAATAASSRTACRWRRLETEFGRKRQIDQSSCNKDYSVRQRLLPELRHGGRRPGAQAAEGRRRWTSRACPSRAAVDRGAVRHPA